VNGEGRFFARPRLGRALASCSSVQTSTVAAVLASAVVLGGCGASPLSDCTSGACAPPATVSVLFQTSASPQALDMLVVVDDTPAVGAIASSVPSRIAEFADVLAGAVNGQPPFHFAVIPGTVASGDCVPPPNRSASCGVAAPDQFLTSDYCSVDPNFQGPERDAFSCLSDYGAAGCGTFQPLEAVHRALADAAQGGLAGRSSFFTPGDALAVIIVAGQDDASALGGTTKPVADYLMELEALAPNTFFPIVIGPPGCPAGGPIEPVDIPRLSEFAGRGVIASVCDASFKYALASLFSQAGGFIVPPCLKGVKDMDLTEPGLQASCVTQDDVTEADGSHVSTSLPMCDATASVQPCLTLVASSWSGGCWIPQITRPPDRVAACGPWATRDRVTCTGCTDPADPACAPPQQP
jgi:hypothetical protein